jgi:uncharacterized repeat protein (TIGR02543 family)
MKKRFIMLIRRKKDRLIAFLVVIILPWSFILGWTNASEAQSVHFSIPANLTGAAGDTVMIPLNIDLNGRRIGSFDATVGFVNTLLTYVGFAEGPIVPTSLGWTVDVNGNNANGTVTVGAFDLAGATNGLTGSGTAVFLKFVVSSSAVGEEASDLPLSGLAATDTLAVPLPANGVGGKFTVNNTIIAVTVRTDPPGLSFTADDTTYTSVKTFKWVSGSNHKIGTVALQNLTPETQYRWMSWSNAGAITQTVAPTRDTAFIAHFATEHLLNIRIKTNPYGSVGGTVTPIPSGETEACVGSPEEPMNCFWYGELSNVLLKANSKSGYAFVGWSGDATGPDNPIAVIMDRPKHLEANFKAAANDTVLFSIPANLQGSPADTVQIPLNLDLKGNRVGSFDATVGFENKLLTYVGFAAGPVVPTALGWIVDVNGDNANGKVSVGAFDLAGATNGLIGSGTAVFLKFVASASAVAGDSSNLSLNGLAATDTNAVPVQVKGLGGKFTITSKTIKVIVKTAPPGRSFTVDATTYNSAQTFTWTAGSSHIIFTTATQSGEPGVQYLWNRWSDNGTISHLVAPTTDTTYTASFTTQYYLTITAGTGGTVSPASNWHDSSQVITITATPDVGYNFNSWTGSGSGSYSGTNNPATVTMSGPITEEANFILGPAQVPDITVEPQSWNFGNVIVDNSQDKIFDIGNDGNATLQVSQTSISGLSDFQILSGGAPFSLSPGSAHQLVVRFTPSSEGEKSDTLRINSNDPNETPFKISLRGVGEQPLSETYAFPNPFNPEAAPIQIHFVGEDLTGTVIKIFDGHGNLVKNLSAFDAQPAAAGKIIAWDGRNAYGDFVVNGVYFYVIESETNERQVGKIAVLR